MLICDRDRKWSEDVRRRLKQAGIRVLFTPAHAPNANAYAERFVRAIKEECLDRLIPIGEQHFRRAVAEYIAHYHGEQDPLDYASRTLHTTADTADHLIADDLRQAAVVVATVLYNTAQRDEGLPRKSRSVAPSLGIGHCHQPPAPDVAKLATRASPQQ